MLDSFASFYEGFNLQAFQVWLADLSLSRVSYHMMSNSLSSLLLGVDL